MSQVVTTKFKLKEKIINGFVSKWSEKNSDFIQQESIT
jgi:hypothetical protein